jgi:transcriptional regulator with XRE-family HTH domain
MLLGNRLRQLREASYITREQASEAIRGSESKISRMELGRTGFKDRDVIDLLLLYGVTDPQELDKLMYLARQAAEPGWWHHFAGILPDWFEPYIALEDAASQIRVYEPCHIPELLQTADYARALTLVSAPNAGADEIEMRVKLLEARQATLSRFRPLHLWAVIDESALRRPVGTGEVMRRQLRHLIEASSLPNVTIQVIPLTTNFAAAGGSFSMLHLDDPHLPDVVYCEQLASAIYLDRQSQIEPYLALIERLASHAEGGSRAVEILGEYLGELSPDLSSPSRDEERRTR